MTFIDVIDIILILAACFVVILAVWNLKCKDDACKNCSAGSGYCVICSHDKYNRSIFFPLMQWLKTLWL